MNIGPGDDEDNASNNPFRGTPFEEIFSAMSSGEGGPLMGSFNLGELMEGLQSMLSPYDGPVNWELATDTARKQIAQTADPTPSQTASFHVADALRLADHWLDTVTELPSGITTTATWSRAEWVTHTMPVWQVLVEPVAHHVVAAMGDALPAEAQAMTGPLLGMLGKLGGAMFGAQVGQAVGTLASEVLTASDIGLPLGPSGTAALVQLNIEEFAEGLGVSLEDVTLYLALREAAHQRLFGNVAWLREYVISAVEAFGQGVNLDLDRLEEQITSAISGVDPNDPEAIQAVLAQGMFEPEHTPAQKAALTRLETILALIEGWVDEVVGQASTDRMPAAAKLREAIRRRRAVGGPAEQTFSALVGLKLRPRRLRDASALWGSLRSRFGQQARDAVWAHPDLLPTSADLDDPLGFREDLQVPDELSDDDFDQALQQLLREAQTPPSAPDTTSAGDSGPATAAEPPSDPESGPGSDPDSDAGPASTR